MSTGAGQRDLDVSRNTEWRQPAVPWCAASRQIRSDQGAGEPKGTLNLGTDSTDQLDWSISVDRFSSEEAYSATLQIKLLRRCLRPSRGDDCGDATVAVFQMLQNVETAHFPHFDIRNYATGSGKRTESALPDFAERHHLRCAR